MKMKMRMKRFVAIAVLALFASVAAFAHGGSHKKLMGTVTKVDGQMLRIKTKDGQDSHVTLTSKTTYVMSGKAAAATDIKSGMRVVVNLATDVLPSRYSSGRSRRTSRR